jgi:para-aminobenzoate synthetase / 4-amino-4-deoxychorismate lyase
VIAAAGGRLVEPRGPAIRRAGSPRALTGDADRPDPARGVFTTMLAREGVAEDVAAHLARLRGSVGELYGQELPADLEGRIVAAAAAHPLQRLRVLVAGRGESVEVETIPLERDPELEPAVLAPVYLPGGLGHHKWRDRRLIDHLGRSLGAQPLIVDLDGEVLEAATANVWIVEGTTLTTPPLDGRLLPGTMRARVLAAASTVGLEPRKEPIVLERLTTADELLMSSAIRGVGPAALAGEPPPRFEIGARLHAAVREPALVEAR